MIDKEQIISIAEKYKWKFVGEASRDFHAPGTMEFVDGTFVAHVNPTTMKQEGEKFFEKLFQQGAYGKAT